MATHDVPGANPVNRDVLAMGCWAEHEDGSLLFVESTEADRVVYSLFDVSKADPVEYRSAMAADSFKKTFTWKPGSQGQGPNEKWLWHDKTPFPWDRVIALGAEDGQRYASAQALMTAAERVAQSLRIRAAETSPDKLRSRIRKFKERLHLARDQEVPKASVISIMKDKFSRALNELRK